MALAGCQVHTTVTVDATSADRGTVSVSVSLDQAALSAVGGSSALAADLDDADLVAAGWRVAGPVAGPDSTAVVTASHGYSSAAEEQALVGELAGSGTSRPFDLALTSRHSFWHTATSLTGTVNLTCGINCFGDSGLTKSLGSPTGVNPTPLEQSAGQSADQTFTFSVGATLPGKIDSANSTAYHGHTVEWSVPLGRTQSLAAVSKQLNWSHIVAVAVVAGLVVLALLGWMVRGLLRRRRRRSYHRGTHRKGSSAREVVVGSGT